MTLQAFTGGQLIVDPATGKLAGSCECCGEPEPGCANCILGTSPDRLIAHFPDGPWNITSHNCSAELDWLSINTQIAGTYILSRSGIEESGGWLACIYSYEEATDFEYMGGARPHDLYGNEYPCHACNAVSHYHVTRKVVIGKFIWNTFRWSAQAHMYFEYDLRRCPKALTGDWGDWVHYPIDTSVRGDIYLGTTDYIYPPGGVPGPHLCTGHLAEEATAEAIGGLFAYTSVLNHQAQYGYSGFPRAYGWLKRDPVV